MSKFCTACGKEIADDAVFCNHCGTKVGAPAAGTQDNASQGTGSGASQDTSTNTNTHANSQWGNFNYQSSGSQASEVFSIEDINANKVVSGLAYLLFFLPLVVCPDSRYGRFHANQALVLLIVAVVGSIVLGVIPIINIIIYPIFSIAVVVWAVIGLINGLNGQAKELPLIGKWRIMK